MISARDDVKLATDIYFPIDAGENLPTVLIRTPYGKENRSPADAHWFAKHGYVVAVQNVRGKRPSEGRFVPVVHDADDGYDTLTWLAEQPWSNGRIGTYGCSYLGENQVMLAKMKHPNHTTMIAQAAGGAVGTAGGGYRYFGIFEGGALRLDGALSWFMNAGVRDWDGSGGTWKYSDMLSYLPVGKIISAAGGETDWEEYMSHSFSDPWWDGIGYIRDDDTFNIPALHVNSWFDYGVSETAYLFNLLGRNSKSPLAAENQFLIISPTKHCESEDVEANTKVRDLDLGDARLGHMDLYVRWFDYWLKGMANGVTQMPKVQIYVMGRNVWRGEDQWPLARAKFVPFYLHSKGSAGANISNGVLTKAPPGLEPPDQYRYNPSDPVPSCELARSRGKNSPAATAARPDVLTYTSPALDEGLEVTGPIRAVLYVSSSARDTDFVTQLIDVGPDGWAIAIQRGIVRSRFRSGFDKEEMMEPGEVYRVEIDMHCTSYYFAPDHRIRLEVSSSHFPYFDRNLNDGSPNFSGSKWVVAENVIHHRKPHSSHVLLPIVH
jgi:putative CocE/NonD family hydrolase